ncbi:hypothetical protein P7C73_g4210, partial [Tremellales sp. Uapishka_1]
MTDSMIPPSFCSSLIATSTRSTMSSVASSRTVTPLPRPSSPLIPDGIKAELRAALQAAGINDHPTSESHASSTPSVPSHPPHQQEKHYNETSPPETRETPKLIAIESPSPPSSLESSILSSNSNGDPYPTRKSPTKFLAGNLLGSLKRQSWTGWTLPKRMSSPPSSHSRPDHLPATRISPSLATAGPSSPRISAADLPPTEDQADITVVLENHRKQRPRPLLQSRFIQLSSFDINTAVAPLSLLTGGSSRQSSPSRPLPPLEQGYFDAFGISSDDEKVGPATPPTNYKGKTRVMGELDIDSPKVDGKAEVSLSDSLNDEQVARELQKVFDAELKLEGRALAKTTSARSHPPGALGRSYESIETLLFSPWPDTSDLRQVLAELYRIVGMRQLPSTTAIAWLTVFLKREGKGDVVWGIDWIAACILWSGTSEIGVGREEKAMWAEMRMLVSPPEKRENGRNAD